MLRWIAGVLLALPVACAGTQGSEITVLGDPAGARRLLAGAAEQGAVPLVVRGNPDWLTPSRIAGLAGRGVRGLDVAFAPQDAAAQGHRLVVALAAPGPAAGLCAAPPAAPSGSTELQAAFCEGRQAVAVTRADATGLAPRDLERLLWRSTARLFPDDYAETYGLDLFGWRVRLGGEASF